MNKIIGIDIGATGMKGGFVLDGVVSNRVELSMEPKRKLEGFKEKLYQVIDILLKIDDVEMIGISSVGNINIHTGEIVNSTNYIDGLTGFNVLEFVKKSFNKEHVYVANDGLGALYGEMEYGAAKGYKSCCMLTLGTGVGGGVVINDEPLYGKNYQAGYLGHMMLHAGGKWCNCGRYGCVEPYLSGRAFSEGVKALGYNVKHGKDAFDLIKKGDKVLENYCKEFFMNLVYVCQSLENIYDPEVVIIGGGLSSSYDDWKCYFEPYINDLKMKVFPAKLKNDAGIIGASVIAKRNRK